MHNKELYTIAEMTDKLNGLIKKLLIWLGFYFRDYKWLENYNLNVYMCFNVHVIMGSNFNFLNVL